MTCRRSILRLAHRHHSRESIPHFGFSVLFGIPSCPSTLASSTFGSVVACLWFSSLPWLFDGQWTYKSIRVTLCLGGLVWFGLIPTKITQLPRAYTLTHLARSAAGTMSLPAGVKIPSSINWRRRLTAWGKPSPKY